MSALQLADAAAPQGAAAMEAARVATARLAAVARSGLLDSAAEESFDGLTRLAATLLDVPASFISVVDRSRDFYKSQVGFPEPLAISRELEGRTFCHHTLATGAAFVIPDTAADPQWQSVPTVASLSVRAYAGIPLHLEGQIIGSLCVVDQKPRGWTAGDVEVLRQLALSAEREIALRLALRDARDDAVRLHALVRANEEMVAVVAHDLRTPLTVLALSVGQLQRSVAPEQAAVTDRMASAVVAMKRMVAELLADHALLGESDARPVQVDAATFLADVADTMSVIATRAEVAIEVDAVDAGALAIDYAQMVRAFCNLLGNAIKYSPPASRVQLRARCEGEWLRIAVVDGGRGMTPVEQARAFDRGWQGAEGLARGDGAGLGLPIVRTLVERHGGAVALTSELGRGTTVTVSLRCA